jgi:hypothetical protein
MIGAAIRNIKLARAAAGTAAGYRSSCAQPRRICRRLCHAWRGWMERGARCQEASADAGRLGMGRLPATCGGQRVR